MKTIDEIIEKIKQDKVHAQFVSTGNSSNSSTRQFFDGVETECDELLQFINEEK